MNYTEIKREDFMRKTEEDKTVKQTDREGQNV